MDIRQYIKESNAIEGVYTETAIEKSLEAWRYLKDQEELTVPVIEETHKLILEDRQPDYAGSIRSEPGENVWVGNHKGTKPEKVKDELESLLEEEVLSNEEALDWHVKFEKIHPFLDGNGRIGRMLYWWQCRQLKIKPIKFTERKRQEYYKLFRQGQKPEFRTTQS